MYLKTPKQTMLRLVLPVMKTDITIRGNKKTYVIDTKFKKDVFQYNLDNFQSENGELEGMLLYPTTHTTVRDSNTISGKKININTINLNQEWKLIENELLELIEPQ
jgi:5-methylcytosine-specific restriction endonuclease McrBC regulatory subunit McrC